MPKKETLGQFLRRAPFHLVPNHQRVEVFTVVVNLDQPFIGLVDTRRIGSWPDLDLIEPFAAHLAFQHTHQRLPQPPTDKAGVRGHTYVLAVPRKRQVDRDQIQWVKEFRKFGFEPAGPHELAEFSGYCNPENIDQRVQAVVDYFPIAAIAPAYISNHVVTKISDSGRKISRLLPYVFFLNCSRPAEFQLGPLTMRVSPKLPSDCSFLLRIR